MSWSYYDDAKEKFVAFDKEANGIIESNWTKHGSATRIRLGAFTYEVDFQKLLQTNEKTRRERALRRIGVQGETHQRQYIWEWEDNKHKRWRQLTVPDQAALEKAFNENKATTNIMIPVSAHDTINFRFDLKKMTQTNPESHKSRNIRRVMGVLFTPGSGGAAGAARHGGDDDDDATHVAGRRARAGESGAADTKPTVTVKSWKMLAGGSVMFLDAAGSSMTKKADVKIAGFSLDETLVLTKSGKVNATSALDWRWSSDKVLEKLSQLQRDGFTVVVFASEPSLKGAESKRVQLQEKLVSMNAGSGGVPISAVVSLDYEEFHKPSPRLFELYGEQLPDGVSIDLAQSFFVGDAAGRNAFAGKTLAGRDKDKSAADRKFAYNVGVVFKTPEEFFLDREAHADFDWRGVSPADLTALTNKANLADKTKYRSKAAAETRGHIDVVLLTGPPSSGKSSLFQHFFKPFGYEYVNRDTLGTAAKCVKAAEDAMMTKRSVVIDNTSPTAAGRAEYVALAKKYGAASVRCVVMDTPEGLCRHLNHFRAVAQKGRNVPFIAFATYSSKKEDVDAKAEGFDEVLHYSPVINTDTLTPLEKKVLLALS